MDGTSKEGENKPTSHKKHHIATLSLLCLSYKHLSLTKSITPFLPGIKNASTIPKEEKQSQLKRAGSNNCCFPLFF